MASGRWTYTYDDYLVTKILKNREFKIRNSEFEIRRSQNGGGPKKCDKLFSVIFNVKIRLIQLFASLLFFEPIGFYCIEYSRLSPLPAVL